VLPPAGRDARAFDDYRAGATTDLEHDGADRDRRVVAPTLVLWGEGRAPRHGTCSVCGRPAASAWRAGPWRAAGTFIPEEQPQAVIDALVRFAG